MSNHLPSKIISLLREEFQFESGNVFGGPEKEALIIVDMQHDFLPGGALEVAGGDEIIPVINQLQKEFELVVFTQDWHPANHLSFYTAHKGKRAFDEIELNELSQMLWPEHCVQTSKGAELTDRMDGSKASLIIRKGTQPEIDSYSAFFDNSRKKSTGLAGYLLEKSVRKVVICGLAADYCVFFTGMDALHLGFEAEIRLDATRAIDPGGFEKKIKEFEDAGGRAI